MIALIINRNSSSDTESEEKANSKKEKIKK